MVFSMRTKRDSFAAVVLALAALLAAGCRNPSPIAPPPTSAADLTEADRLLEGFRERGAFPGGVLAVGYRGIL